MFCTNSKITEKQLEELGLFAIPCSCEQSDCRGWAMITMENIRNHIKLYCNLPSEI